MIREVILPKLGQTMEEGTIVEWFKKEGDEVRRGDVLFSVESDKAILEVEAPGRGFLRKILVPAGEKVPVLTVVGLITSTADEQLEGYAESKMPQLGLAVTTTESSVSAVKPGDAAILSASRERVLASPRARRMARQHGVDFRLVRGSGPRGRIVERDVHMYLETKRKASPTAIKAAAKLGVDIAAVTGSGIDGRITKADVEAAARTAAPPQLVAKGVQARAETVPLTGVRSLIAERMAISAHTTARVTLVTEVDATRLVRERERLDLAVADEWGFAPGYNDLLGTIVAHALQEFPYMNARLSADGGAIERLEEINLGIAVDTQRGLLVPVIRNADRLDLRDFGTQLRALVERAREGKSLPDDLSGGTFTITNLGMYDIDAFTPIINLPECAILGVGRIQLRAVPRGSEIVTQQMMTLSLTFDHRLVDGAPAARFLQRIKELIEDPYRVLG